MKELVLGKTSDGRAFSIPLDSVARKFAVIGVSGSGKTCTVACMAEQMHKQGLIWTALDPVGNFWGLRSGKDGDPKGRVEETAREIFSNAIGRFGYDASQKEMEKTASVSVQAACVIEAFLFKGEELIVDLWGKIESGGSFDAEGWKSL